MAGIVEIRNAEPSERRALGELRRRSSWVWEEDQAALRLTLTRWEARAVARRDTSGKMEARRYSTLIC